MIPLMATVRIRVWRHEGSRLRLWLPVPLVILWLLLLPVVIVLLPVFVIACLAVGLRPLRTLSVLWGVLGALRGTDIAVERAETSVHVHLG